MLSKPDLTLVDDPIVALREATMPLLGVIGPFRTITCYGASATFSSTRQALLEGWPV